MEGQSSGRSDWKLKKLSNFAKLFAARRGIEPLFPG